MWVAEFNTFEKAIGRRRPVLTHLFYGDTREEALDIVRSHMQTDSFFNGCTNKGKFGNIDCWSEYRIYQR